MNFHCLICDIAYCGTRTHEEICEIFIIRYGDRKVERVNVSKMINIFEDRRHVQES